MNETARPERRRFQFGLRRLLLWTAVVALAFGVLSSFEPNAFVWIVLPGWFATVLMLRWEFGSKRAAMISVVVAMTAYALLSIWALQNGVSRICYGAALGLFGGLIGFVLFLLVEGTCRTVNWIDSIGQSDE